MRLNAGRHVHRQPRNITSAQLAFACVDPYPDLDAQSLNPVSDGAGAFQRLKRRFKADEASIAGRIDLDATMAIDLLANGAVVLVQQGPPASIAELSCVLG